ncbi:response regulator transcription factor [bacterium]|nr:response regulator transcription factor [bacterium]
MKFNINSKKYLAVVQLILKGYSTQDIAKELNYSIGTVRNIYADLREKWEVNSKTGIALAYVGYKLKNIREEIDDLVSIFPGIK